jgi:ubiquinone/menaquinone biosynthesis C-methylase UbiE
MVGACSTSSHMTRLFPSSEVIVPGDPADSGFHRLETPDAFRWIGREARCLLPTEALTRLERPMIRVTAQNGSTEVHLSLYVDGRFVGTQPIDRYGSYYFAVAPGHAAKSSSVEILLRVDHAESVDGDPRVLGVAIYGIDSIDLNAGWDSFEERRYLADQIKVFRPTESGLSRVLSGLRLGPESLILDVGAGMGWTTVTLAARTGAMIHGVDLRRYDSLTGRSFKAELLQRFERHLPVLMGEQDFKRFGELPTLIDACSFQTMDAERLLFQDDLFDFVFSLNALEHIRRPERALRECSRVLKPGGQLFCLFMPIYFADSGHHLGGLIDIPWIHLLYDRSEIKQLIRASGKPPNEVDNILDSLNGYSLKRYVEMFARSDLNILEQQIHRGFSLAGSETSEEFRRVSARYPEQELSTLGMTVVLQKPRRTPVRSWRRRMAGTGGPLAEGRTEEG